MLKLERSLRFLRGTPSRVMTLEKPDPSTVHVLVGDSDSDWAGDLESRKSTSVGTRRWGNFLISRFHAHKDPSL